MNKTKTRLLKANSFIPYKPKNTPIAFTTRYTKHTNTKQTIFNEYKCKSNYLKLKSYTNNTISINNSSCNNKTVDSNNKLMKTNNNKSTSNINYNTLTLNNANVNTQSHLSLNNINTIKQKQNKKSHSIQTQSKYKTKLKKKLIPSCSLNKQHYILNKYVYKQDANMLNEVELFKKRKDQYELGYYQYKMIDLLKKNIFEKESVINLNRTFTQIRRQMFIPKSNYDSISNKDYIKEIEHKEKTIVDNINSKSSKLIKFIEKKQHKKQMNLPKICFIKTVK